MRALPPPGRSLLVASLLATLVMFGGCSSGKGRGAAATGESGSRSAGGTLEEREAAPSSPAGPGALRTARPGDSTPAPDPASATPASALDPASATPAPAPDTPWLRLAAAARDQMAVPTVYVPDYVRLDYPGGDVPQGTGVCTDVVIRALRAIGRDLQVLIHEDMRARFDEYPKKWGLTRPDPHIDHRRVPNQICFLRRFGRALPTALRDDTRASFRPGDLVYWKLPNGLDHCGVLSTRRGPSGLPLAVHNLGRMLEEDCVAEWQLTGHFRYPPDPEDGAP